MKILEELLQARGFTHFLALTYNVDLGWFESLLWRQLQRHGIRRATILADERELSVSLERGLSVIREAGRGYVTEALRPRGRFHPKLYLLTGPQQARLYVGSGNLSPGGLNRNLEVFQRWEVTASQREVPQAFETARQALDVFLAEYKKPVPRYLSEAIRETFGTAVLTTRPLRREPETELWASAPRSMLEQLDTPPSRCGSLKVLAPFFDERGEQVVELARRLRADTFEVLTDVNTTNLTPRAVQAIERAGGKVKALVDSPPLHAKVLHAKGAQWALGIFGSANASLAAWKGLNAELVVTRRGGGADDVDRLLATLRTRSLDKEDLKQLQRAEELRKKEEEAEAGAPGGPPLRGVTWVDATHVRVELAPGAPVPSAAEARVQEEAVLLPFTVQKGASGMSVQLSCRPPIERGRVTAVRLHWGQACSGWSLAHDPRELAETARLRSRSEEQLDDFVAGGGRDPEDNEAFLRFLAEMWQERLERGGREAVQAAEDVAPTARDASRELWVSLREEDFQSRGPLAEAEREEASSRDAQASPSRLLLKLLFGDTEADAEQGESGDTEPNDREPPSPPGTRRQRPPGTAPRSENLVNTAAAAAEAYRAFLRRTGGASRDALRIQEDLTVLAVALQRAMRARQLTLHDFLNHLVPVLRDAMDTTASPLPLALGRLPTAERKDAWLEGAILPATALLLYNVCLAESLLEGPQALTDASFAGHAPVLWFRHVLRHVPEQATEELLTVAERQLPRLQRCGDLWLADEWPQLAEQVPFKDFLRQQVQDAQALHVLEALLRPELKKLSRDEVSPVEDGDTIIGIARGGLASGFVEALSPRNPSLLRAQLFTGSFQRAEAEASSRYGRMHAGPVNETASIDTVLRWAEGKPQEILAAVQLLARIAG